MTEHLRETYFLAIRTILLLSLEMYIVLSQSVLTGASGRVLLLLALFVGAMTGKELVQGKRKIFFLGAAVLLWAVTMLLLGKEFILLGILLCYEVISYLSANGNPYEDASWSLHGNASPKVSFFWYGMPFLLACVPSRNGLAVQLLVTLFLAMIYIQHDFVVASYKKQTKEDNLSEQRLKRNMYEKEHQLQEEMNRGLLKAENMLLEERSRLTQTLHDKLGHNINGSIYQLEAVKLVMEEDPAASKKMIQAVIDQLRTGMDSIRAVLRKERPRKYKLALLQLRQLCEECNQKGVETELITEGELAQVPENYLEIILDNAYEAVSNSLKYAKCTRIEIKIHVLNQLIRCSISDNGVGCEKIVDGMGLSGMRRRVREVNGILDFESAAGFSINMLLPL